MSWWDELQNVLVLGTQWFLMGMDRNCKRIDLIRGSHPPYIYIYTERERERERERDTLMH